METNEKEEDKKGGRLKCEFGFNLSLSHLMNEYLTSRFDNEKFNSVLGEIEINIQEEEGVMMYLYIHKVIYCVLMY